VSIAEKIIIEEELRKSRKTSLDNTTKTWENEETIKLQTV
jgi:hypothetical protein